MHIKLCVYFRKTLITTLKKVATGKKYALVETWFKRLKKEEQNKYLNIAVSYLYITLCC